MHSDLQNAESKVTGFISFYALPSSISRHEKHKSLNAIYLYYYALDCDEYKKEIDRTEQLTYMVLDCLVTARDVSLCGV
jgi:hypothetical protein